MEMKGCLSDIDKVEVYHLYLNVNFKYSPPIHYSFSLCTSPHSLYSLTLGIIVLLSDIWKALTLSPIKPWTVTIV